MEETALHIVMWLIVFTGAAAIVAGCLWLSLYLFGKIIKYLGYWTVTLQAVQRVYRDKRK